MATLVYQLQEHSLQELNSIITSAKDEQQCILKVQARIDELITIWKSGSHLHLQNPSQEVKIYFRFDVDKMKENPISIAASKVYWLVVPILMKHWSPSTYDALDNRGYAFLHYACYLGLEESIDQALAAGASINLQSRRGYTPLHQTIIGKRFSAAKLLISVQDCDLRTKYLNTCKNEEETPLSMVADMGEWNIASFITENHPLTNTYDNRGYALIHYACYLGLLPKVQELIQKGVDINMPSKSKSSTPLHQAIIGGRNEVVRFLVAQPECDLTAKYVGTAYNGDEPLALAAHHNHWEIAKLIVEKLPLNDRPDNRKCKLIDYACYLGMLGKVKELMLIVIEKDPETSIKPLVKQAILGLQAQPVKDGEHSQVISYLESAAFMKLPSKEYEAELDIQKGPLWPEGLRQRRIHKQIP